MTLSALLKTLSNQVWWHAGCIYTNCTHLSRSLFHALDTLISHPRCWLVVYRYQRGMLCFQQHGFNKTKKNAFGQREPQRSICGRKFSTTDTFFCVDASAVVHPGVWEGVKLSGQTQAVISLFSGTKWTSNQTQAALFCLSFNTVETFIESKVLFGGIPCLCWLCTAADHLLHSMPVEVHGETGGIKSGRDTRLNQITANYLRNSLLCVVQSPLPSFSSIWMDISESGCHSWHSRCSIHLHLRMKNEPRDSKDIEYTSSPNLHFAGNPQIQCIRTIKLRGVSTKGVTWGLLLGFCKRCQLPTWETAAETRVRANQHL